MRLIIVLLTTGILQVSASGFAQKLTYSKQGASLQEIFMQIRKQTNYLIVYSDKKIDDTQKIDVNFNNAELKEVLDLISERQSLMYIIDDKTISFKPKTPSFLERVADRWAAIDVHGRVVDQEGKPLPGATVKVKGTGKSVSTNTKGEFYLEKVEEGVVLGVSFIGYVSKEVVAAKDVGDVILELSDSKLDEIQVIAYGTTTQRLSTGNISTVKAVDIEKAPVGNVLLAIAGRVPGVFIQQSSGVPGSGVKILIQGQNSIGYGNDPFYVVDGVPYTAQLLPGLTNELGQSGPGTPQGGVIPNTNGNPLNFINPQDIESIDVLKDADATAIYGSRAANGAIIITTKKGKAGKTTVNFNIQRGWGEVASKLKLMNTSQYLEMRKEAYKNASTAIPAVPSSLDPDLTYWSQNRYTDWQKELLGGTAKYMNAIASMSGGSANTQFLVNVGYQSEGTVTPGDFKDQKASMHFNLNNTSENKRFKFKLSGMYVADNNKLGAVNSMVNFAYTLPPNAPPLYNIDGGLNWELLPNGFPSFSNPLANLYIGGYTNKTNNLIANTNLSYELTSGLELKSSMGYNRLVSDEIVTNKINYLPASLKPFRTRTAQFNSGKITSWIIEPQLSYLKQFGAGKLDLLLGTTIQQENRDRQNLEATGFASDNTLTNIKAASSVSVVGVPDAVILSTYKYNALFLRMGYSYAGKYLLNVSARRDGSSRFGKENRFHNFGSIAAAWIFSEESLIKSRLPWLSFGKIRSSLGTTGSDQIGDYGYLNLYSNTINGVQVPYQGIISLQPSGDFPNPYLQWEETKKISTTLDLGFFNDGVLINMTYFKNVTGNQLLREDLVSITGGSGVRINLPAKVQNTGLELGLGIRPIERKDFSWTSNFNFTQTRNKMYAYSGTVAATAELDGRSLGVQKVYHYLGVDQETGLYTFARQNGLPTSNPSASTDKTVFIDLNPSFFGGLQNSIRYKSLTLDFLCQFVKQMATGSYFGLPSALAPGFYAYNQPVGMLNRWQKEGDQANIQKYTLDFAAINSYFAATQSDKNLSDASYMRLKNLSLSCNLPTKWLTKAKFQSARLYVQGQNLFTITNYPGVDPENRTFASLPPLKTLTLGIQMGL